MRILPILSLAILGSVLLTACSEKTKLGELKNISGGRSATFSTDGLAIQGGQNQIIRTSSTLGVFVTEYLTNAPIESSVQGAISAIATQSMIMDSIQNVNDPDFVLLQTLQDALRVDVSDILNRSDNREETLDAYTEALTNIATHANDRFKELSTSLEELKKTVRTLENEKNDADRNVKQALKDKDYETASSAQKILVEKEVAYSEADLKRRQVDDIVTGLDQLLEVYGQKILAIQENREILISGLRVVDVPGVEDLKIIQRIKENSTRTRGGSSFDTLFDDAGLQ